MTLDRPTKLRSSGTTAGHRDTRRVRARHLTGVDTAMLQLVRAVDGDRRVLRRIRARVMRAANGQEADAFGDSLVVGIGVLDRALRSVFAASLPPACARSANPRGILQRG